MEIKQEKVEIIEEFTINFDISTNFRNSTKNIVDITQELLKNVKTEPDQEFSIISNPPNQKVYFKTKNSSQINESASQSIKIIKCEPNQNMESIKTEQNTSAIPKKSGVQCNFCSTILSQKRKLNEHVVRMHPDKLENLYNCKICNSNFVKHYKLEIHMKTKHLNEKIQQFECDFDGKIFKTKGSMYRHMSAHQSSIKCKICQAELKLRNLLQHMKNSHYNLNVQCEICLKSFRSQYLLKAHQNIHNKRFECNICNKKFPELNRLRKHEKEVHESLKNFECEDCHKKFSSKSRLKLHQKTHIKSRPKPLKCQRCKYATDRPQNYKAHQKFHENQDKKIASMKNPIKCSKCAVLCRNKDALWQHNKKVHSNIEYQCDLCGQYGKIKKNMERHLMIVHMKRKDL